MDDILKILEGYISEENPRKRAKLSSRINYRWLQLLLLKEILVELRELNGKKSSESTK